MPRRQWRGIDEDRVDVREPGDERAVLARRLAGGERDDAGDRPVLVLGHLDPRAAAREAQLPLQLLAGLGAGSARSRPAQSRYGLVAAARRGRRAPGCRRAWRLAAS